MVNKFVSYLGHPTRLFRLVYTGVHKGLYAIFEKYEDEYKPYINFLESKYRHPLAFVACYGGANLQTIEFLFENGANSHHKDFLGRNIVHIAANSADPLIVNHILSWLDMEPMVDEVASMTGQTPFHALCYRGSEISPTKKSFDIKNNLEAEDYFAAYLQKMRAKPKDTMYGFLSAQEIKDLTPLKACWHEMRVKSKKTPQEILSVKDAKGLTPLMIAKYYDMTELLEVFAQSTSKDFVDSVVLPENIDELMQEDFWGRNKLQCAILCNDYASVSKCLDKGINPNAVNEQYDMDSLQLACYHAVHYKIIELLASKITVPLRQDCQGRTALHIASHRGSVATLQVLLNSKEIQNDINVVDNQCRTALHAAIMHNKTKRKENQDLAPSEQVIDLLFTHEIDFAVVDNDENGKTALELAETFGNELLATRIRRDIAVKDPKFLLPISGLVRFSSSGTIGDISDCSSPTALMFNKEVYDSPQRQLSKLSLI